MLIYTWWLGFADALVRDPNLGLCNQHGQTDGPTLAQAMQQLNHLEWIFFQIIR